MHPLDSSTCRRKWHRQLLVRGASTPLCALGLFLTVVACSSDEPESDPLEVACRKLAAMDHELCGISTSEATIQHCAQRLHELSDLCPEKQAEYASCLRATKTWTCNDSPVYVIAEDCPFYAVQCCQIAKEEGKDPATCRQF